MSNQRLSKSHIPTLTRISHSHSASPADCSGYRYERSGATIFV